MHLLLHIFECVVHAMHATDLDASPTIAGDQAANLWWRMLHGETFEQHPPQMSVMLIGINDLAIAASCGAPFVTDAADGIAQR